jgi:D-alanyl-D-alanine carboxypeptidase
MEHPPLWPRGDDQVVASRAMIQTRALVLLTLLALAPLATADAVDDLVRNEMMQSRAPAVAVGVFQNGQIIRAQGYGIANVEYNVPATPDTVFRIASMSKQFAAASILLLEEEGKVALSDPITRFLPDAPEAWNAITFRHLMSHTSGIPDADPADGFTFRSEMSDAQYLRLLYRKPLKAVPGTTFEYSNPGYSVLGILVNRIAGKPLDQFVTERIFEPLGMSSTRYYTDGGVVPTRAGGSVRSGQALANALFLRPKVMDGSGGILSSVNDLAKYDAALYTDRPLSQKIREAQFAAQAPREGGAYGFGWFTDDNLPGRMRHSGGTNGFTSNFIRNPGTGLTVVVLQNIGSGGAIALSNRIYDHYATARSGEPRRLW